MKMFCLLLSVGVGVLAAGCLTIRVEIDPDDLRCRSCTLEAASGDTSREPGGRSAALRQAPVLASSPDCTPPDLVDFGSIPISQGLDGLSDNVLAAFDIDGDELVGVAYANRKVAEGALALWRELVLRIPTNQRMDLVQLQIFEGGQAGFVSNGGTGGSAGRFGQVLALNRSNLDSNPADPCAPLSRRRGNFDWTLIHEFAHMRGYVDGAINDYMSAFAGKTGPGDGYPEDGSPRLDGDWVTSYAERAGGDEDFAESFTTFVMLDELPAGDSIAARKVRWFASRPGYPELRLALRISEPDGSTAPLDPAPRLEFPFTIEPATWMMGTWRGAARDGIEVEYRITADDIERIHRRDGVEIDRVRYGAMRDGGVLATIDLYDADGDFYLHQVSVAGSNFSESFRRGDDAMTIEHEQLGEFTVRRIAR